MKTFDELYPIGLRHEKAALDYLTDIGVEARTGPNPPDIEAFIQGRTIGIECKAVTSTNRTTGNYSIEHDSILACQSYAKEQENDVWFLFDDWKVADLGRILNGIRIGFLNVRKGTENGSGTDWILVPGTGGFVWESLQDKIWSEQNQGRLAI